MIKKLLFLLFEVGIAKGITWIQGNRSQSCSSACAYFSGSCAGTAYWPINSSDFGAIYPFAFDLTKCSSSKVLSTCSKAVCSQIYIGDPTFPQDPEGDGDSCYIGGGLGTCDAIPDGSFRRFCPCNIINYIASTSVPTITPSVTSIIVPQSKYYYYTGTVQLYVVPPSYFTVYILAYGAAGGLSAPNNGGLGGYISAAISVTPGETLYIFVGGQGGSYIGGYNGGGYGTCPDMSYTGGAGGGGGATDIRRYGTSINDRLVVAGGGGGAGYDGGRTGMYGGGGGGSTGGQGGSNPVGSSSYGGRGGSQTTGGSAGYFSDTYNIGMKGYIGQGGDGGEETCGGGGGGGYFGGGGGAWTGGGGGSSYSSGVILSNNQGVNAGNGYLVISTTGDPINTPTSTPTIKKTKMPSRVPVPAPTIVPSARPSRVPASLLSSTPTLYSPCFSFNCSLTLKNVSISSFSTAGTNIILAATASAMNIPEIYIKFKYIGRFTPYFTLNPLALGSSIRLNHGLFLSIPQKYNVTIFMLVHVLSSLIDPSGSKTPFSLGWLLQSKLKLNFTSGDLLFRIKELANQQNVLELQGVVLSSIALSNVTVSLAGGDNDISIQTSGSSTKSSLSLVIGVSIGVCFFFVCVFICYCLKRRYNKQNFVEHQQQQQQQHQQGSSDIEIIPQLQPHYEVSQQAIATAVLIEPHYNIATAVPVFQQEAYRAVPSSQQQQQAQINIGFPIQSHPYGSSWVQQRPSDQRVEMQQPQPIMQQRDENLNISTQTMSVPTPSQPDIPYESPYERQRLQHMRSGRPASIDQPEIRDQAPIFVPFQYLSQWCNGFSDSLCVGQGTFGKVYKGTVPQAFQTAYMTSKSVAVKRIGSGVISTIPVANLKSSVQAEIRVLSSFTHPNIIRLIGYCTEDPNLCLVYEFAELGDLNQAIRSDNMSRKLTHTHRIRIGIGMVSALNYLHSHIPGRPAYHRDVNSANIALMSNFTAKLIDCGLAKFVEPQVESLTPVNQTLSPTDGSRLGTLAYMCPWYMRVGVYDARSEIYSVGIVLLELLTGKAQGALGFFIDHQVAAKRALTADDRIGVWPEGCSGELFLLGKACLANYHDRLESMVDVLRALRNLEKKYCKDDVDIMAQELAVLKRQISQFQNTEEEQKVNERRAECSICFDNLMLAGGVECPSDGHHFLCISCFSDQIRSQVGVENRGTFVANNCTIQCLFCFHRFDEVMIASKSSVETYALYRRACDEVREAEICRRERDRYQKLVDELKREYESAASAANLRMQEHILHITDNILNLKCPRCSAVFIDFEGCLTRKCTACDCEFCGWCFTDCGDDAHIHLRQCQVNPKPGRYYATLEEFNEFHLQRRQNLLLGYLNGIGDLLERQAVRNRIQALLLDRGIIL